MLLWEEETEEQRRIEVLLETGKRRARLRETERLAREARKEEGDGKQS